MRLFFFLLIFLHLFSSESKSQSSIHNFQVDSITGTSVIDFSKFNGKKILVVNTSSQDSSFSQFEELKQLNKIYKDSLIIVVFPSNSFNSETNSTSQLVSIYQLSNEYTIQVASKINVSNSDIHPIYNWLTKFSLNGRMDSHVSKPFYKYLLNKNGQLIGVYIPRVKPMSHIIRNAIDSFF